MMEILGAIEASGFSMWVKESSTAYVSILAFHTWGLVFLVSISGTTALRILGVARSMPLAPMEGFFPLMWVGLLINAVTGSLLLLLYPTKYFVDLSFYIKLACVVTAIVIIRKLQLLVFHSGVVADEAAESRQAKQLAVMLLLAWLVATVTGRVMAYSVATKIETGIAAVVMLLILLALGRLFGRKLGLLDPPGQRLQGSSGNE